MKNFRLVFNRHFKAILFILIFSLVVVTNASAADVTVAWDANSESDLAGYILCYGTASGDYTTDIDVGNKTEHTIQGLAAGTTYYFGAKAYDNSDNQSDFSKELVYTIPVPNSAPNTPAKPTGPSSGYLQTSYSFDTSGTDPDGDLLTYRFDWGDGNISAWGGAFSRTHAYSSVDTYCIKAQSEDTKGLQSGWSACLNVSIDVRKHTISASAGLNGNISPSGSVTVDSGNDRTFTISPNQNYRIVDVVVDGSSVGKTSTYTFDNVDKDHSIAASFVLDNQPPVSKAGSDQTVQVNATVQLDGGNSSDANGDSLTYNWSIVAKPSGSSAKLSDTKSMAPSFGADVAGTYSVRLVVNDGTVDSAPDTVTIVTQNSAPLSDAGNDQSAEERDTVTLSGLNSTDPDNNIASYTWKQTDGIVVTLSNSKGAETTFIAPNVTADTETLTFQLTVQDSNGLQDVDTCAITVTKIPVLDSDDDGVPDDQDAFPHDPDESLDTDGDGEGNNTDSDDDNDGMPDSWEQAYGLNPLKNDANDDPDNDDISNINEYNLGTKPDHYEGNYKPGKPVIISPEKDATVSLTPQLETGEFNDPNINDVHIKTQWKLKRAFDNACVFDVTSDIALTSITVPKQILEEDTEYIWQVRYIDNHDTPSDWSEEMDFITDLSENDQDDNGVPDDQEVSEILDLDEDGTADIVQSDIKCVNVAEKDGTSQVCVSIRNAVNVYSIESLEVEDPNDPELISRTKGKPNYFEFGMLDFKLLVNNPGDETTVTIYLSKAADNEGKCYKYDPVNRIWQDYSIYTKFSPSRQEVYLTLKDGGFGDADGIENGIIVDPLAFGSESDPKNDNSDSAIVFDKLENDKIKWKLTNESEIVATLETLGFDFPESYGAVKEIKLGKDVIFKASESGLNVEPSVAIGEDDWTESNVDKRRIDPGKTEALEVKFTDKGDRAGWLLIDPVGGVSFAENCAAEFPLVGGCALGNPAALVFEYTGAACDATTNDQEGKFKCEEIGSSLGDLESVEMTKDANKISVAISGNKVTIFYDDPVGEKFPSEIKYNIIDVDGNTQSQTLQTSCSKALHVGDQFGALTLGEFIPED